MKRLIKTAAVFIAAAVIFTAAGVLTACSPVQKSCTEEFFSMDTFMRITVYGDNAASAKEYAKAAKELILHCDALYSVSGAASDSEVVKLNKDGRLDSPSQGLTDMLTAAAELNRLSLGRYDLTVLPLTRLWGFSDGSEHRVPNREEIQDVLENVGMDGVMTEDGTVVLNGRELDLGSCAKGYAANEAAKYLKSTGVQCAVLTLGGNVQTVGRKPDGSDFIIGIADPFEPQNMLGTLRVGECAVVTAGSYQRFFESGGKKYSHIIDASTGYPCDTGLVSVTVVCADGMIADMLSTVFMLTGLDGIRQLYSIAGTRAGTDTPFDFEAVAVSEDGRVSVTPGIAECFAVSDGYNGAEEAEILR